MTVNLNSDRSVITVNVSGVNVPVTRQIIRMDFSVHKKYTFFFFCRATWHVGS